MATQDDSGIEFSILPQDKQQHFRLLELPADLLQLVTSDKPPTLQLKSTESSTGNNNVVLCTPDKTYDLRQVSTSNSLFVAQPLLVAGDNGGLPEQQLQAVAQVQSTLEILSKTPVEQAAVPYIGSIVPAYTSTGHALLKERVTKEQAFANIPLSRAECEAGWRYMACFELDDDGHCALPGTTVKLAAWRAVLGAATAAGIDLTQSLNENALRSILEGETDFPSELYIAVVRSMAQADSVSGEISLDPTSCAGALGGSLLNVLSKAGERSVPVASFQAQWEDLLPEAWRGYAVLGTAMEDGYRFGEDGQHISSIRVELVDGTTVPAAKSTQGAKRKWHEKFRATKKAS